MFGNKHTKWLVVLAVCAAGLVGWLPLSAAAKPAASVRGKDCTAPPKILTFTTDNWFFAEVALPWAQQFVVYFDTYGGMAFIAVYDDAGGTAGQVDRPPLYASRGASWWRPGPRTEYAVVQTACGTAKASLSFDFQLKPVDQPYRFGVYDSAGDSYSSGEGDPPFIDKGTCHVSPFAWPGLMFDNWRAAPFFETNLACSGAHIADLFRPYRGQPSQLQRLKELQPDLVTLTIGGNDANFSGVLLRCFLFDCVKRGTIAGASQTISHLRQPLAGAYRQLRAALPKTRIVVVGYPRLFPMLQKRTVKCGWLEPAERTGLNRLAQQFDTVVRLAVADAGIEFVSTLDALNGHELCTRDSWVIPIGKIGTRNAGHPLPNGQQAISDMVEKHFG